MNSSLRWAFFLFDAEFVPLFLQIAKGDHMTADKKLEILELSKSGMSLKKITEETGLSMSYVKKIVYGVDENQTYCLECGKIMTKSKYRPKKYCSAKCKREYYKKHPEILHKNKFHKLICPCCHHEFLSYGRSKRKYCSKQCSTKSRYL